MRDQRQLLPQYVVRKESESIPSMIPAGASHQSPPLNSMGLSMPVPFFHRKRFYSSIQDSAARNQDQMNANAFSPDCFGQFDDLSASNISTNFSNLSANQDKFENLKQDQAKLSPEEVL
jgi:hypothetical protein